MWLLLLRGILAAVPAAEGDAERDDAAVAREAAEALRGMGIR